MLNTPNEWHNEEDIDEFQNEELSDEEYEEEPSEDEDNYSEDEFEYNSEEANNNADKQKKMIIIAVATIVIILLLVGGVLGLNSMKSKNNEAQNTESVAAIEEEVPSEGETEISADADTANTEDDISIAVEDTDSIIPQDAPLPTTGADALTDESNSAGLAIPTDGLKTDDGGLQIEADSPATGRLSDRKSDSVTVSIGDVGRQNPFMPKDKVGTIGSGRIAKTNEDGLNFEVIEPPQLAEENPDITKLLQTKVSGILYDEKKPSAIINIDGIDQLVKVGDVLSGFEIIAITHNKVVISSDSNVYRASVGQPLNAELVTNYVEISNLETKFKGSKKIR